MEQNYHCSITVAANSDKAFACIADVGGWWAKGFKGKAYDTGDTFTVQFGETMVAFEIVRSSPGKEIMWKVTDCYLPWLKNKTEWNGTEIAWQLTSLKDGTRIYMTHIGLYPGIECFEACQEGWDGHIKNSLYQLINEGKGQPE
jgi:hypothetical protein